MVNRTSPVENCLEWKYKCPMALSLMTRTGDPKVDHCAACDKNVYICDDLEDLMAHVRQQHCVAFDPALVEQRRVVKNMFARDILVGLLE